MPLLRLFQLIWDRPISWWFGCGFEHRRGISETSQAVPVGFSRDTPIFGPTYRLAGLVRVEIRDVRLNKKLKNTC